MFKTFLEKLFKRKPRKTHQRQNTIEFGLSSRIHIMTAVVQRLNFTFENVKIWLFCCQRTIKWPGPKRLTFSPQSISHCGPVQDSQRSIIYLKYFPIQTSKFLTLRTLCRNAIWFRRRLPDAATLHRVSLKTFTTLKFKFAFDKLEQSRTHCRIVQLFLQHLQF